MNDINERGFKTHIWKDKAVQSYCKGKMKPVDAKLFDERVADVLRSQGFVIPEGSRSNYQPDKLFEALNKYAPVNEPKCRFNPHLNRGIALAYKIFAKDQPESSLIPLELNFENVDRITSNPTGSSGLTNFPSNKRESKEVALNRAINILLGKVNPKPCICFTRTQFNGENQCKTRLIWGYPYEMTILEGIFARPIIDMFTGAYTSMAFGVTSGSLGTRLRRSKESAKYAYSLDMSAYDSSVCRYLINVAFDIISSWFDLDSAIISEVDSEVISQLCYKDVFRIIRNYFIYTPIVMPDGKVYYGKRHGVPSGSYFTQLVDSIVNVIIAGSISDRFSMDINKENLYVLGDDQLFFSDRLISLSKLSIYVWKNFNIKIHNDSKSNVTQGNENIRFLGRVWDNSGPTSDERSIIMRLVYPERFRHYSEDSEISANQVKLLFKSMASVYRDAWRLLETCYTLGKGPFKPASLIERLNSTFKFDGDGLTGYQRYKFKYEIQHNIATMTAMLYWL